MFNERKREGEQTRRNQEKNIKICKSYYMKNPNCFGSKK